MEVGKYDNPNTFQLNYKRVFMDLQNTFNQISKKKKKANHLTERIPQNFKLELVIFTKFRNLN